jgi:hypothetical protein
MDNEFEKYDAFDKQMKERFPKIFAEPYGGFCCGEGWWPILEELCDQIQHHINWKNKQSEVVPQVTVGQIKEKFGGLRFYYSGGDDEISGMVRMAESWASRSCETCGAPGTRREGGWLKTLCDHHEAGRQAARAEYMKSNGLEE